eukprot:TRINITY_DN382_c0_g1_i1.p1 TRINITY_DN382_c0_g1~~TRINITY_DN382_c0_g1_i1.p1  ORF type:complete len:980 (-),score=272.25 TRINITY_DN382_c0_g1_i1:188-3127(-)
MKLLPLAILGLSLLCSLALATRPEDEIVFDNTTYHIMDEVYTFRLVPVFKVPLQILRHRIYTSTSETVQKTTKRALVEQRENLYELSEQDHRDLSDMMGAPLPAFVKINSKKRSLPASPTGVRVIPLTREHMVLFTQDSLSSKRSVQQDSVPIGSSMCLHIPFFTTCDNSADLDSVKATLQYQVDATRAELDSYKKTNDARANEMTRVLNKQRDLINSIASQTQINADLLAITASGVAANAAQLAHGDYLAHAQINYLKRVTGALLRYTNALASTDPRSVVAQPAMSKLFRGYLAILEVLKTTGKIPIVDSRTFDFTEKLLPSQAVNNITTLTNNQDSTLSFAFYGFSVQTKGLCTLVNGSTCQKYAFNSNTAEGWMYGPFHQNHYGIYGLLSGTTEVGNPQMSLAVGDPAIPPSIRSVTNINVQCVQFLGYKVLANFTSTPYMKNGLPADGSTTFPLSDCNNYLLRYKNNSDPVKYTNYRLFAIYEGLVVPLFSNCKPADFAAVNSQATFGWLSTYPTVTGLPADSLADKVDQNLDVNSRHWVTSTCYINMDPAWIGMEYYISDATEIIHSIPRGYKMNQFTVNPAGELASSLEFIYTNEWAQVYSIERISTNKLIVDEVDMLQSDKVLFRLTADSVVDESDSFYGPGNNGRDCIQYNATGQYDYDILNCFFQNDQNGYTPNQYLLGLVQTTGIARFVNKFQFTLYENKTTSTYSFSLKPKNESDFSFYFNPDGVQCPRLLARSSVPGSCNFEFFYVGSNYVSLVNNQGVASPMTFSAVDNTATVTTSNGTHTLVVSASQGGPAIKSCLQLTCQYSSETSYVLVQTPNVQIVSKEEQKLVATIDHAIEQTITGTIADMNSVQDALISLKQNLTNFVNELNKLDFNVTKIIPYEDFTALRAQVDQAISGIGSSSDVECKTPWDSATCFFNQFGATLITIAAVAVFLIASYVVCIKFGVARKLFGGRSKGKGNSFPMSAQ